LCKAGREAGISSIAASRQLPRAGDDYLFGVPQQDE
jgi:hypothetical protein